MAKAADDKVVMTRDGYEKLKAELVSLRGDGRAEIAAKLEEARAFGDLS
ncbi:MAG: transcription elongation factor GreA, partial [Cloacibacillus porcorum]|nr:transcription elongation factor GreA [Cloacibacillus porcorum]